MTNAACPCSFLFLFMILAYQIFCFIPWNSGTAASAGGALLLSSCWRHYSVLLHMEDQKFPKISKELLEQYLSGIKVRHYRQSFWFQNRAYGIAIYSFDLLFFVKKIEIVQ